MTATRTVALCFDFFRRAVLFPSFFPMPCRFCLSIFLLFFSFFFFFSTAILSGARWFG